MKKILLTAAAVLVAVSASAQTSIGLRSLQNLGMQSKNKQREAALKWEQFAKENPETADTVFHNDPGFYTYYVRYKRNIANYNSNADWAFLQQRSDAMHLIEDKYNKKVERNARLANARVNWGLRAGLNYTMVSDDQFPYMTIKHDISPQLGFHFGVTTKIKIVNHLYAAPELLYTNAGFHLKENLGNAGMGISPRAAVSKFHTLSMPVLVGGQFGRFRVYAGPEVVLLSANKITTQTMGGSSGLYWETPALKYMGGIGLDIDRQVSLDLRASGFFGESTITARYPGRESMGTQQDKLYYFYFNVGMFF